MSARAMGDRGGGMVCASAAGAAAARSNTAWREYQGFMPCNAQNAVGGGQIPVFRRRIAI
jgi:hypothetical protein